MKTYLYLFCALLFVSSCYEDRIACLDPDASNYDLRADEACPDDCCNFPLASLEVTTLWGEEPFSRDSIYQDAAGNDFRVVNLRFYLGDLQIVANDRLLPTPENALEIDRAFGTDTTETVENANLVLVPLTGGNLSFGNYRRGLDPITGLECSLGLPGSFNNLVPTSAPNSSPLATQPGLLHFGQDRGYVQASLEYSILSRGDTLRQDVFGTEQLAFELPNSVLPQRGRTITFNLQFDARQVFSSVNLLADPESFASQMAAAFTLTGAQ